MARWRLKSAHYLNSPGNQWESKETDQFTGRTARKMFDVPIFLDPKDVADHNYPGEIIVAYKLTPQYNRDIIFRGKPTPEMEPIDDEATKISESLQHEWKHPIDELSGVNYTDRLLADLTQQLIAMKNQGAFAKPEDSKVDQLQKEVAELKALLADTMKKIKAA